MRRKLSIALLYIGVLVLLSFLIKPVTATVEQQMLDLQYSVRGPLTADTNIVILYFDNDDITALGGWPLKRNFYALLIDVLDQAGAAAIGIDVFFGERHAEYPEYDALLAAKAGKSGKVVFSSYFRRLNASAPPMQNHSIPDRFCYQLGESGILGDQLQAPLNDFLQQAAGIGHINFDEQSPRELPVIVRMNGSAIAAFSVELLRLYYKASQEDVRVVNGALEFGLAPYRLRIPLERDGIVHLNFPGPFNFSTFHSFRCVEVLRSFELQRAGFTPPFPLMTLKNKIVLIGVVGEGRSLFVPTPFSNAFPAIALHATAIDNALNQRFLRMSGVLVNGLFSYVLALVAVFFTLRLGELRGILATLGMFVAYALVSQFVFVIWNTAMPLFQPLFVVVSAVVTTVVYEHRLVKGKIESLESEKALVESELRARELKLQTLERELRAENVGKDEQREVQLSEEIMRYKRDIKTLTSKVTDLVEFELADDQRAGGRGQYEGITYDRAGTMAEVVQLTEKIAVSDVNILILGESGTGKELVARAIHNRSNRRAKPFVAINCGAIPETLLESELFGHEKGAFTGAAQEKKGRFEYADGGTIFLDVVAETSEAFQVKLLRVVQSGEFERVGSSMTRKVNVRILAATNKDVKRLLKGKNFREDLYYRLNVFTVQLPPLRERKGDIPLLTEYFVRREGDDLSVSSTVVDAFLQYRWPGNVRELESTVKRAVILTKADGRLLIRLKDLPDELAAAVEEHLDLEEQILQVLREKKFSRSSISEAAQELGGLNRGTVAEYFRGTCFKYFLESGWDLDRTAQKLSDSSQPETGVRVRKKLTEYLSNVVDGLSTGGRFEEIQPKLKPKYKNLPQRYHPLLNEIVRAYLQGKWALGSSDAVSSSASTL